MRTNRRKKLNLRTLRNFYRVRAAATTVLAPRRTDALVLVFTALMFIAGMLLGEPAHAHHSNGCQPHDGVVVCVDPPEVFCYAPRVWDATTRTCKRPEPVYGYTPPTPAAKVCAMRITWLPDAPAEVVVDMAAPNCDATARRALAQALSELLGN